VVVGDTNGVLLGLRGISPGKGAWSFPSGYVNRGEVLEEAAAREVLEEMQFEVRITSLIGVYSAAGDPVILVAYAGERVAGEPRPDGHESLEVRTFPLDALPPMAFSHDPRIIADWRRLLGET
jgi:ADP-ribose pyrophosphatase YjhB (NUDIX family)